MGNNIFGNQILNKHQKLYEKHQDNDLDTDLIFFNIPITFEHARQPKSYFEQLEQATDDELYNCNYNELYLSAHKVIILSDDIIINVNNPIDKYHQISIDKDNIQIYKHFDFVEDNNENIEPYELSEGLKKINDYKNEIQKLNIKIREEKKKILNLDYIKSKFNKPVPNIKEYIHTLSNIHNKLTH
jgi:hypothetical protein